MLTFSLNVILMVLIDVVDDEVLDIAAKWTFPTNFNYILKYAGTIVYC